MNEAMSVYIQVIRKPERKVIIKRGKNATDYFAYCEEVGCDVWGILTSMDAIGGEPVCLWLPEKYRREGTSQYVQGVEVELDYHKEIPEGFEVITLPAASTWYSKAMFLTKRITVRQSKGYRHPLNGLTREQKAMCGTRRIHGYS